MTKRLIVAAAVLLAATALHAQSLTDEIKAADAAMFSAYNAHDIDKLMTYFSNDLEFYHDKDGLATAADVREGLGGIFKRNDGIRRDLVPGSLEVYTMGKDGAIEIGEHRFCHVENGKDDCGTFKFVHIWRKNKGQWQVTRVVSYGH
jgi:ketosteroid isomerase-like protein